jgi:hypothetical protein
MESASAKASGKSCCLLGIIQTTFYNKPLLSKLRGNHGKPKQCAAGASLRAQASAVASGEVRSSDLSDRVVKRFGNIPERKSTYPNHIGSFTTKNGAGAKGEMGKGSPGIAARNNDGKTNGSGSCKAHHVRGRPEKDRGVSTGKMGKDQTAEEGCVVRCQVKSTSHNRNQHVVPNVTTRSGHLRHSIQSVDCD